MFSFHQKGLFVQRKGLPENLRHFEWRFRQCEWRHEHALLWKGKKLF